MRYNAVLGLKGIGPISIRVGGTFTFTLIGEGLGVGLT